MSKKIAALVFGHNEYAYEVAKNIEHKYENVVIYKLSTDSELEEDKKYELRDYDISDNWEDIQNSFDISNSVAFCMIEDDAENIFLTISLRSSFGELNIIALSGNKESANKLTMAGANKVIPVVQTTASIISDMLKKPIVTDVLHNILYEKSDLKVAQIAVRDNSCFDGAYPSDIDWTKEHDVIVLSIIHEDMNSEFIYSSKARHHAIKKGDIFVVVGYVKNIIEFEQKIGGNICQLG